jgi:hypothetical protein
MNKSYKCYRCFFITDRLSNLKSHFNRKKNCNRNPLCTYTEDEIYIMNKDQIDNKYKHACSENLNFKIKDEIQVPVQEEKQELDNINETQKDNKKNINHINTINQTNNTNNTNNTMNITNNFMNININISNNLVPFNEDWDLSTISEKDKIYLVFSKVMYTKLLELILKNDINSNVIIDNNSDQGLIFYKFNDENKYEHIKLDKLVSESVSKLHKQLIDIYKSIMSDLSDDIKSNIIKPAFLNEFLTTVEEKYDNFQNKNNIKKNVEDMIIEIYKNNQNKALMIMKEKGEKKHLIEF